MADGRNVILLKMVIKLFTWREPRQSKLTSLVKCLTGLIETGFKDFHCTYKIFLVVDLKHSSFQAFGFILC